MAVSNAQSEVSGVASEFATNDGAGASDEAPDDEEYQGGDPDT